MMNSCEKTSTNGSTKNILSRTSPLRFPSNDTADLFRFAFTKLLNLGDIRNSDRKIKNEIGSTYTAAEIDPCDSVYPPERLSPGAIAAAASLTREKNWFLL